MTGIRKRPRIEAPVVLTRRPESALVWTGSALVAIHRALLDGPQLAEVRRAVDVAAAAQPDGLVLLTAYRLSPEFPLRPGFDTDLRELAETLRALDRVLAACATVIEFGGVRAAALRAASRAVLSLARPRAAMGYFDRISDAIPWLLPHAEAVGGPSDPAAYVRLYRAAERALAEVDAERAARGERPAGRRGR